MTDAEMQPANVRALHGTLGIGASAILAVCGFLYSKGIVPLTPDLATTPVVPLAITAISATALLAGLLALKPAVPRRKAGQTVDDYFLSKEMSERAMLLWTVLEGGTIIGAIGFALTGAVHPAVAALAGLVCLIVFGPRHFAGE